ncbi:beta-lactamase (plasmid) [Legionella adelaidensis]|uniref:beta-lactamase n=1 Tax=Legionella adelaidensis TaxID=45056 RepID=A0A0W0R1T6_9GAMM|nr:class A beta-lactamase [Legionella adelaidensis]KTC65052.1 beta-lactamase [Legionella adelaidensis]VEH85429.1 beta-lactamase [Legionella adelaidensis]
MLRILVKISLLLFTFTTYANNDELLKSIEKIENSTNARIGFFAINTANNTTLHYRADERFPMGCTSKVIGVAAVLHKSMHDENLLSKSIHYTKDDLTNWTPITEKNVNAGMSIQALCAAAISYSDNTAMNLLVKQLGGLDEINGFARTLHNDSFRQDHNWPEEALSGGKDISDSSTPRDMARSVQRLVIGNHLNNYQKDLLIQWLKANTTGDQKIRAGVPKDWVVGDKTGTGSLYGTTNDIAVIWPPHCQPIVLAIYYTNKNKKAPIRNDIVASVTKMVIQDLAKNDACLAKT